jgi:LSD1 subclass zinc finger protein
MNASNTLAPNAAAADTAPTLKERVRTFPCRSCGAKLSFAPGSTSLKCGYCGTVNEFDENTDRIEELDLPTWLKQLEGEQETVEQDHVKCQNCGGEQTLPGNLFASSCVFCGTAITSQSFAKRRIKPRSLVPFQITKQVAQQKWREWLHGLWLAPSALKKYAQSDAGIRGLYVPYWTFDANTVSDYTGQRGDNRTESYTTTDSNGNRVTRTRVVTDWRPVSGVVSFFHNDVLVSGSRNQLSTRDANAASEDGDSPNESAAKLGQIFAGAFGTRMRTWDTRALVPYQDEYIAGFQAEAYSVDLKAAFVNGKHQIDAKVEQLIRADIGGDHQRIHSVNTQYSHLTFKHVLLPMWISAYLFKGKTYRFVVNGQSGEVDGESPKSGWKIFFLVSGILLLLFLALVFAGGNRG